jgi:hypothetical protein
MMCQLWIETGERGRARMDEARCVRVWIGTDGDQAQPTGGTRVLIDGVLVPRVREVAFVHTVGDVPRVFLEILPDVVEVTGHGDVRRRFVAVRAPGAEGDDGEGRRGAGGG